MDITVAYAEVLSPGLQPGGGDRLCPPNNTGTYRFSDLPTALRRAKRLLVKQKDMEESEMKEDLLTSCVEKAEESRDDAMILWQT